MSRGLRIYVSAVTYGRSGQWSDNAVEQEDDELGSEDAEEHADGLRGDIEERGDVLQVKELHDTIGLSKCFMVQKKCQSFKHPIGMILTPSGRV